jgi:hypothetical protein
MGRVDEEKIARSPVALVQVRALDSGQDELVGDGANVRSRLGVHDRDRRGKPAWTIEARAMRVLKPAPTSTMRRGFTSRMRLA